MLHNEIAAMGPQKGKENILLPLISLPKLKLKIWSASRSIEMIA